jgi:hypothetical protein
MLPADRKAKGCVLEAASAYFISMGRRPKTPEELRADLKAFEAAWKREMARAMRNAVERMLAAGSGRRLPAKYKMKLPRLLRTVSEPSPRQFPAAGSKPRPYQPNVVLHRSTPRKNSPLTGVNRRRRTAEILELKRHLANAVERVRAFRDRRSMPTHLDMTFFESRGTVQDAKAYQDSARSAAESLLTDLRDISS